MLAAASKQASARAAGGSARENTRDRLRRQSTSRLQRARRYHPVALNFGRPDIGRYIAETIEETAVLAEWAPLAPSAAASADAARSFQPPPSAAVADDGYLGHGLQKVRMVRRRHRLSHARSVRLSFVECTLARLLLPQIKMHC